LNIKQLWNHLTRNTGISKELKGDKTKIPWNIYDNKNYDEAYKQHKTFHEGFKYKFFTPLLWLAQKILGKYLLKKAPSGKHNLNLKIFDEATESAIDKIHVYFLRHVDWNSEHSKGSKEDMLKSSKKGVTGDKLRTMKNLVMTMAHKDTFIREFLNVWMFEMAELMIKNYPEHPHVHLFYNKTSVWDVRYAALFDQVNTMVRPADHEKVTK